jgi:hypothetical protein
MKSIAFLIGVAALTAGCHNGYVNPPLSSTETPPNMTPTTLRVTTSSRNDQKIDVTATVLSTDGHYVPGVTLTFAVDVGTITAAAAATDYTGAIHAVASTPTATTLHVKGGGLATDASLPASVQQTPSDGLILNVAGIGTTGVAQQMFISSTAAGPWSWSFGDGATDQTAGLTTSHTYGRLRGLRDHGDERHALDDGAHHDQRPAGADPDADASVSCGAGMHAG